MEDGILVEPRARFRIGSTLELKSCRHNAQLVVELCALLIVREPGKQKSVASVGARLRDPIELLELAHHGSPCRVLLPAPVVGAAPGYAQAARSSSSKAC